jgi:hypothetical protein
MEPHGEGLRSARAIPPAAPRGQTRNRIGLPRSPGGGRTVLGRRLLHEIARRSKRYRPLLGGPSLLDSLEIILVAVAGCPTFSPTGANRCDSIWG